MLPRHISCVFFAFALFFIPVFCVSAQQQAKPSRNTGGTGTIFVSNSGDNTISVIPVGGSHVTTTIPLGGAHIQYVGNNMYLSQDGAELNVITYGSGSVQNNTTVISTVSDTVTGTHKGVFFMEPPACLSSDGKFGYFSSLDWRRIDKIPVIDSYSETETLQSKAASASAAAILPVFSPEKHSFALSPDDTKFYILDTLDGYQGSPGNVVWVVPAATLADRTVSATRILAPTTKGKSVPVISAFAFGAASLAIPLEDAAIPVGKHPFGIAVSPDGGKFYVTNEYDNTLSVISASSNAVVAVIPVGHDPHGVAVSPDGSAVYVVNYGNDNPGSRGTVSIISTATNEVTGTIRVGRGPVGIAVSGESAVPAQDVCIRTDFNRNGTVSFDDTDKTTSQKPYTFWLNDNSDVTEHGEGEDQDPAAAKQVDNTLSSIRNPRDFEDFERLQIRLPAKFNMDTEGWKITLQFADGESHPEINVVPAPDTSLSYLLTPSMNAGLFGKKIGPITNQPVSLSLADLHIQNGVAPLLFEGVSRGKGTLIVCVYKPGVVTTTDKLYLDLRPVTEMYDHYTADPREYGLPWQDGALQINHVIWHDGGDSTQVSLAQILTTPRLLAPSDELQHDNKNYVLFVHGWRMKRWERIAFAQTAFKRLWHLGYRGRFGFFSWPTEYTDINPLTGVPNDLANYNYSERKAYASAQALHSLLVQLKNHGYVIHIFAHSMGNVVASEALHIEAALASPRQLVQIYVASQSAVPAQAYDAAAPSVRKPDMPNIYAFYPTGAASTGHPYFGSLDKAAGSLVNFFNSSDYALDGWGADQDFKHKFSIYYYDDQIGFYRSAFSNNGSTKQTKILLNVKIPDERYEIFSRAVPAYSNAAGDQGYINGPYESASGKTSLDYVGLGKPFTTNDQVNLGLLWPYPFGDKNIDHSAQFEDTFGKRQAYWNQLLISFGLGKGTPN